jgi:hypothetical protein
MKKLSALIIAAAMIASSVCALAETSVSTTESTTSETSVSAETSVLEETAEPSESPDVSSAEDTVTEPAVSPEPTITPTPSPDVPQEQLSKEFKLTLDITPHKYTISSNVTIELYNSNGELVGTDTQYVGWDTPTINMVFEVPEYRMGETFKVKLVSGLRSIQYYDDFIEPGGSFDVLTFGYINDQGEYVQSNGALMGGNPGYEKEVNVYIGDKALTNIYPEARLIDGTTMIPVRAIGEAMGLDVTYNPDDNCVICSAGDDKRVVFYVGNVFTTIYGIGINAPHEPVYIENSLFVPLRTLAEAFEASVESEDFDTYLNVKIGTSPIITEYLRQSSPVNANGITSRTPYLVWVSKSEYTVRVYEGEQYNWRLLKEYPCALGAWDTPTITGQFEYIEKTQWNYDGYYVGPVLRFYNGYALHSTLLYYGGGEYDGRVGVNISHGCIRLHPDDINWISDTIPFYTRIYITE